MINIFDNIWKRIAESMGDRRDFWWAEYLRKLERRESCVGMETTAERRRHSSSSEATKKYKGCKNKEWDITPKTSCWSMESYLGHKWL